MKEMTPTAKYALTAVVVIGMTLGVVYLVLVLTDQDPFSADWLYYTCCELLFAILLCYLPSGEHALVACVCGREKCFVSLLARRLEWGSTKLYCFWHDRSNRKEELVFFFWPQQMHIEWTHFPWTSTDAHAYRKYSNRNSWYAHELLCLPCR